MNRTRLSLSYLALIVSLSGCAVNRYKVPVGNFRAKTQQTIGVIGDFYASRNSYEVELYLDEIAADNNLEVLATDTNGSPTPLGQPVFSPAGIRARRRESSPAAVVRAWQTP